MLCPKCSAANTDKSMYCGQCGAPLSEEAGSKFKPKQAATPPPKNYLVESIVITILCCLPIGIVAILNSAKVEKYHYNGDIEGAIHYSQKTKKLVRTGFIVGLIIGIITFIFQIVVALAEKSY